MMLYKKTTSFLTDRYFSKNRPFLLALSGGVDSLCLFYCLLAYREEKGISFHVAHVNHNWREESQQEADSLRKLASSYDVPFHFKSLDPSQLKGNLEEACRNERYQFFATLHALHDFEAILTGHHQNDQAETVFKRLAEGAHWSSWIGLKEESHLYGIRVLRPLLTIPKKEIYSFMAEREVTFFEDRSNHDRRFLRARMRKEVFPWLNEHFGKQVEGNFAKIGEEAQELVEYFQEKLKKVIESSIQGKLGIYWDLQTNFSFYLVEIKYFLRLISKQRGWLFSRSVIEQAAQALFLSQANRWFGGGENFIYIDRKRLFIFSQLLERYDEQALKIQQGYFEWEGWKINIEEGTHLRGLPTSWKEGWLGKMEVCLPSGDYSLLFENKFLVNLKKMKKRWNQEKVPAVLSRYFPLVTKGKEIVHEFLTGKSLISLKEGEKCWKLTFNQVKK